MLSHAPHGEVGVPCFERVDDTAVFLNHKLLEPGAAQRAPGAQLLNQRHRTTRTTSRTTQPTLLNPGATT